MLNLSNEVFNALWKYLSADWNIEKFRDHMVGLRLDKYHLLASADRLFLDEFEGRYAEFCDLPPHDEQLLKASLAAYVQADEAAPAPAPTVFWSISCEPPTESVPSGPSKEVHAGSFAPACDFSLT